MTCSPRYTMTLRCTVTLGLVLGFAASCASHGSDRGNGSGSGSDPDPTACPIGGPVTGRETIGGFDYKVTGGLVGGGDGTSLQIDAGGFVTRHTRERGTETGQLDPAALQDLMTKARTAAVPTLCASYGCLGCADDFIHRVTVKLDGIPYTVQASELTLLPPGLGELLHALQQIVDRPLS
jgi:hypothetical protein